jgi:hypothetical protein
MSYLYPTEQNAGAWVPGWPSGHHDEPDEAVAAVKVGTGRYVIGEPPPEPVEDDAPAEPPPPVQVVREPFYWLAPEERAQQIAAMNAALYGTVAAEPEQSAEPTADGGMKRDDSEPEAQPTEEAT